MNLSGKKFYLILIFSVLLVLLGIFSWFFINKNGFLNKNVKNNLKIEKKLTELEKKYCSYAKKTLDWMDSINNTNGKNYDSVTCDYENKTCNEFLPAGNSGHEYIPNIWARYKYLKKTNDKNQIGKLKKDIDLYFNQSEISAVQNDFWNCKILLELDDNSVLENSYIEKVKKICISSTYSDFENINEEKINKDNFANFEKLKKENKIELKLDPNFNDKYRTIVTVPSDLVAKYKINQDKNNLELANTYFNKLLVSYYTDNINFSYTNRCLLAISSLDLYSVNKDKKYLDWAKEVHLMFFNGGIMYEGFNPECGFLNRELIKYDQNNIDNYKKYETDLIKMLINKYYDGDNQKHVLTNQGGFFRNMIRGFTYSKDFRENALMVNLLCN